MLSVNGIEVVIGPNTTPEFAAARELLRQRAVDLGLIEATAESEETIEAAIEALLEREVATPVPTDAECRRYYEQHPAEFLSGDLVHARHILFQVTSKVNVPQVRARAEATLNELLVDPTRFEALAAELSNCPSSEHGGNLGQIGMGDMVPELEKALFKFGASGILRELVKTRFGFHIVAVDKRIPGSKLSFDIVQEQIAERLCLQVEERALHQYISILAGQADIQGVDLNGTDIPLVQ